MTLGNIRFIYKVTYVIRYHKAYIPAGIKMVEETEQAIRLFRKLENLIRGMI